MINKEFFKQLEDMARDKNLELELLTDSMSKALINSYKKTYASESVRVVINPVRSEILVFSQQLVVNNLEDQVPENQHHLDKITLENAQNIKPFYKVGDIVELPVNIKEFGRAAIAAIKSVFSQGIKVLEREKSYKHFKALENEMITGTVLEIQERFVTLSIGHNTITLLPKSELLANDDVYVGQSLRVYIKKVEETTKDPKVFVSRSDKNLVTRLLESVIPEIKEGIIEIKGIARDPGDRTKIALYSNDSLVDAIGSCVGEGGSRIKEVVNALNGEKIDLYKWSEIPEELVANSLQPSKVTRVLNVDLMNKTSLAVVPDDQLSLAIGKQGQNVRLAVLSCGWKIDIKPTSEAYNEGLIELFN